MTSMTSPTSTHGSSSVTVDYLGHCSFLWATGEGVRAVIDPYRNNAAGNWFLRDFPAVEADVVMTTHSHFDHDAAEMVAGRPTILRGPGRFQWRDLTIDGVADLHARREGREPLANVIFTVEVNGVRFCHMGDNRSGIAPEALDAIGRVDVFMVNVDDSRHLLSFEEVEAVIQQLKPLVVVPMHYLIPELTNPESTLETIQGWLKSRPNIREIEPGPVSFSVDLLPVQQETWVLTPQLDKV